MATKKSNLLLIPYAYGGNTGLNIQKPKKQFDIYMKNCSVACLSAVKNIGSDTDVALVTNAEVPEPYKSLLTNNGVLIISNEFDSFNFQPFVEKGIKVKWQLAFYKLCALRYCVKNLDYQNYAYLDSDVFIQGSFENIWKECSENILLYDFGGTCRDSMLDEMKVFDNQCLKTHWGGEFYASNKQLAEKFSDECLKIYEEMIAKEFMTVQGDEFITSVAAARLREYVKNAGAYIFRYWTGSFRLICNNYKTNDIAILHLPAEKEQGILRLYSRYISRGIVPSNKKVWKIVHLNHRSLRVVVGVTLRKMGLVK